MKTPEESVCVIHMNDGTKLTFQFPPQVGPEMIGIELEKALNARMLAAELDGSLVMIPTTSIKSVQVTPAPTPLPRFVIHRATFYGKG
ncbi:MAG: hypothetical protein AB1578_08930 [Thermodesulfobacteriota bacterium]|jgi:hypothetical protein